MPDPNAGLMVQKTGDVHIVEFLESSLLDQGNIEQIHAELRSLVEAAAVPKFVISFENVGFISSAVLGVLMSLNKKIQAAHGELRLANISPRILEVFKITRLDKIVKIYKTTDDALVKFSSV